MINLWKALPLTHTRQKEFRGVFLTINREFMYE